MSSSLGEIVKDVLDKNGLLHLLAIFRSWIDNVANNLAATANTLQTNINNLATRVTNVENKLKPPSNANNKFVLTANGSGGTTWRQLTATDVTNVVSTSGGTITGNLNVVGNLTQNGLPISTKIFQAGTTAPSNKNLLWIDTNTNGGLKYYNGSAWVLVPVGYT